MWRSAGSGPVNPQDLNRYAYALNNPLTYTDPTGHWVETAWDLANLALSAAAVWQNPSDPWNWAALAADTASTVLPIVPGGGRALIRAAAHADTIADALPAMPHADNAADAARAEVHPSAIHGRPVYVRPIPTGQQAMAHLRSWH
jgi:pyocin large subunit-like protein